MKIIFVRIGYTTEVVFVEITIGTKLKEKVRKYDFVVFIWIHTVKIKRKETKVTIYGLINSSYNIVLYGITLDFINCCNTCVMSHSTNEQEK